VKCRKLYRLFIGMEISTIIPHIEAIIFASEKPVTTMDLVELINNALGFMEDRATLDQVESALDAITEKYKSEFYPFQVLQSGGGWQFLTKKEYHSTVSQLNGQKFLKKLSTAALETLSIIAYKQPITKGEIEDIRGVNCDYAVQKLLEKELVIITGRKENAPGQPLIYATSKTFMDYFGINSPADLPQLGDVASQEVVNPTIVGASRMVDEDMPADDNSVLAVNEQGEIVLTMVQEESSDIKPEEEIKPDTESHPGEEQPKD
jgi:segregation and condensation protein B